MVYNFNFYSLCLGEGTAAFPFPPHIVLSRSPCFFPSTDGAGVGEEIYKKATAHGIAKSWDSGFRKRVVEQKGNEKCSPNPYSTQKNKQKMAY